MKPDFAGAPNKSSTFARQRRRLLQSVPALLLPAPLFAQGINPVAVQKLHSFELRVSDVARSLAFYQDLFAAPVVARQGESVSLRIGSGPQYFKLSPVVAGESPSIGYIGLSVEDFQVQRVQRQLQAFGVNPGNQPAAGAPLLQNAMQSWTATRRVEGQGEAAEELYFADIEGVRYLLMSGQDCGGGGLLGASCSAAETAPGSGRFQLTGLSHFTNFLANRDRANEFYTRTFGKQFQAYQGPGSPVIGVGDGLQFLMYVGGDAQGAPQSPGRIDHVCFTMSDFNVDNILAALTDYGLSAREDPANTQPLMHWVSMRMPNRGGAAGGTPEVYFSDPDGLRIQLQDPVYCGGGGYLGDDCPAPGSI